MNYFRNYFYIILKSSSFFKIEQSLTIAILKVITPPLSLQAEVSHNEAKRRGRRGRRETSAGPRRHVSYQTSADGSLTTSNVFVTCNMTHPTGLQAKLHLKVRMGCEAFFTT